VEQGKLGEKVSLQKTKALNKLLEATTSLDELFAFLIEQQLGQLVFSTSLGQEDQVLTHHIGTNALPISVFTLDTGRLFQETYDVLASTQQKFKLPIKFILQITKPFPNWSPQKDLTAFTNRLKTEKNAVVFVK